MSISLVENGNTTEIYFNHQSGYIRHIATIEQDIRHKRLILKNNKNKVLYIETFTSQNYEKLIKLGSSGAL